MEKPGKQSPLFFHLENILLKLFNVSPQIFPIPSNHKCTNPSRQSPLVFWNWLTSISMSCLKPFLELPDASVCLQKCSLIFRGIISHLHQSSFTVLAHIFF
ncbi:hypothetical protein H1C71_013747, partial [Ictidomys tridecemlineatus]